MSLQYEQHLNCPVINQPINTSTPQTNQLATSAQGVNVANNSQHLTLNYLSTLLIQLTIELAANFSQEFSSIFDI